MQCARQGHLVSRFVTTGWAVLASSQPRDFARGDARLFRVHTGCQMRRGASVTCAPLRRRQMACFSRACPYSAAALLRHSGPLLQFKKSASGCCLARACPARRGNLTQLEPGLCLSGPTWDSGMVGITVTRTRSGGGLRVMAGASAAPDGQPVRSQGARPVTAPAAPGSAECNSP